MTRGRRALAISWAKSRMTQAAAARVLGITQPRLNALLKGRIGLFSLDALVNIASRAATRSGKNRVRPQKPGSDPSR